MKEKLEFKILGIGISILIIGSIFVGFFVLLMERSNIYKVAEGKTEVTAKIITKNIERTMLQGQADITRQIVKDVKETGGLEIIEVVNADGREAFNPAAPANEARVMSMITSTQLPLSVRSEKAITFYNPLKNTASCKGCHPQDKMILGAVKISASLEKEYDTATKFMFLVMSGCVSGIVILGFAFRFILKKFVIWPIQSIEKASHKMALGDLSFSVDINTRDEIGRLSHAIKNSMGSISTILERVRDISVRVSRVTKDIESESRKVTDGTQMEAEAIANISSSQEQLNSAIAEIAESVEALAVSVEETAASVEEMATAIESVNDNTEELSIAVESTSSSIEELSATIREVTNNTEHLAVASEETLSAMEQITTTVREVEGLAKESAKLSEKVTHDASSFGMTSIEKTIEGMGKIKASVEKTADFIKKLGGRSNEIGKILTVIDDITDQTTLLALNAAILAAQAKEHGKGFSVVADEIKDLAERTSLSTQEIGSLIQSVQQEVHDAVSAMAEGLKSVEEGFKLSKEAGNALKQIVVSSKKSSEMALSIERATAEEARAAKIVSAAVESVRAMIGQIAKATQEESKGMALIMKAAEKMKDVAQEVKRATSEQTTSSRQITQTISVISNKSQHISRAINEQKIGSNQIWDSLEKIKDIPKKNRELSFMMNNSLRNLFKDAELIYTEMEQFKFAAQSKDTIRVGVIPLESPADMFRKFSPFAEFIGRKIGKKVELKVAVDFENTIKDLGNGTTQICYMTPSTYIEANKIYGVNVIAKALREGKPYHHAVIIARTDSNMNSLNDIRGRTFAFGDLHSTSGHIVPRMMLVEAGIELHNLNYYNYLGHHDDVAKAVLNGDFDAGGLMESTAQKYIDKGIKILKYSDEIPEFNICANTKFISEKDLSLLKSAIISLTDARTEGSSVLWAIDKKYTGFTAASDEDYNNIRLMMSKMGML